MNQPLHPWVPGKFPGQRPAIWGCPGPPYLQLSSESQTAAGTRSCRKAVRELGRVGARVGLFLPAESKPKHFFPWCRTKMWIFIHNSLNPLWWASKSKPNPYSRGGNSRSAPCSPTLGCAQHQQMGLRDREWGPAAPGPAPGCGGEKRLRLKGSWEVSAQCGLLKLPSLPQIKKRKCLFQIQEERLGEGRACRVFCREDRCSEVGTWCSAPGPAATAGFMCSLACITQGDTWNGLSPFSRELKQFPSKWTLEHPSVLVLPFLWQPPKIASILTPPPKAFRGS